MNNIQFSITTFWRLLFPLNTAILLNLYRVNQNHCDKLWGAIDLAGKQPVFSEATFMSYVTSKRRQVLRDIYNYEWIIHVFLQVRLRTFYRCSERLPWTWLHSLHRYSSECRTLSEHLRSVLNLFKNSNVYSHNQFLSGVNWVGVHDTLHMPPKKKSRGIKSGDRAGHANPRRTFSMDDCKQLLA
jgi:hypothetical protein